MNHRTITVLGGAGYLGSVLCRQLLRLGFRVRCFDVLLFGQEPVDALLDHPRFVYLPGNIRDRDALASALEGADAVVHLASLVGDASCNVDPDLTVAVNLEASQFIAELAPRSGVQRLLFSSTCSVYGGSSGIVDESSPTDAGTPYTRTKLAAEEAILAAGSHTFQPTVLRLATVFGVSPRMRFDLAVNVMVAQAEMLGRITVFNGERWRPFIHTTDVARAFIHLLLAPREAVFGSVFNVGSSRMNWTIGDVGRQIAREYPRLVLTEAANGDGRDYRVDFSRIEKLGFQCQVNLEQGIREVGAYVRAHQPDIRDSRYQNGLRTKERIETLFWHDHTAGAWAPASPLHQESAAV
jgi:nucleoside-diphosphate-sugar epimerase